MTGKLWRADPRKTLAQNVEAALQHYHRFTETRDFQPSAVYVCNVAVAPGEVCGLPVKGGKYVQPGHIFLAEGAQER